MKRPFSALPAAFSAALALALAAAPAGASPAFAAGGSAVRVENNVSLGQVSIRLEKYSEDGEGREIPFEDGCPALPGQWISEIVRIRNLDSSVWLRVQVSCVSPSGAFFPDEESLLLADPAWVRRGDHYYLTVPVPAGGSADFLRAAKVPERFGAESADRELRFLFRADAVQSEHFTPDFGARDPWFGTLIEQRVYEEHVPAAETGAAFRVEYRGGAEGLVRVGDDFFSNWGELLPGDDESDEALIRNDSSQPVRIWFHAELAEETGQGEVPPADPAEAAAEAEMSRLSEELLLTIRRGDELLYDGPLSGCGPALPREDRVLLGTFRKGDSARLSYRLRVPEELTNRFALSRARTVWVFEAAPAEVPRAGGTSPRHAAFSSGGPSGEPSPPESGTPDPLSPGGGQSGPVLGASRLPGSPATGDRALLWLFPAAASLLLLLIFASRSAAGPSAGPSAGPGDRPKGGRHDDPAS